ncbi:MAG: UpxY family transcription antiterminator [Bryobacteraceae bacterium]
MQDLSQLMPWEQPEHSWYAVRVKSNCELVASVAIKNRGYEEFLPVYRTQRRWSDRIREIEAPLFPGYVFARLDPFNRLPILTVPGVVGIVSFAKQPIPIPDVEIDAVRRVLQTGAHCGPWPLLKAGQLVRIERGSLAGIEGILVQVKSRYRLVISVSILQRSVAVEVDSDSIRPIDPPKPRSV